VEENYKLLSGGHGQDQTGELEAAKKRQENFGREMWKVDFCGRVAGTPRQGYMSKRIGFLSQIVASALEMPDAVSEK